MEKIIIKFKEELSRIAYEYNFDFLNDVQYYRLIKDSFYYAIEDCCEMQINDERDKDYDKFCEFDAISQTFQTMFFDYEYALQTIALAYINGETPEESKVAQAKECAAHMDETIKAYL